MREKPRAPRSVREGGLRSVSGIEPSTITPEDLIAYIDGEAPPRVVERIESDPALAAEAREYARVQNQLRVRLHRFDCPPPERLGEYDLGLLAPAERTRIAAHLRDCPHCTAELAMLRAFLATEPDIPPVGAIERVRRLVATLLPPPPLLSPHARLRGADDATARTYQADDVTITLDLGSPVRRGLTSLVGLIWRDDADPETIAGSAVILTDTDGTMHTTAIDELGNFTFDDISPGTYHLEVTLGNDRIAIEGIPIGQ